MSTHRKFWTVEPLEGAPDHAPQTPGGKYSYQYDSEYKSIFADGGTRAKGGPFRPIQDHGEALHAEQWLMLRPVGAEAIPLVQVVEHEGELELREAGKAATVPCTICGQDVPVGEIVAHVIGHQQEGPATGQELRSGPPETPPAVTDPPPADPKTTTPTGRSGRNQGG